MVLNSFEFKVLFTAVETMLVEYRDKYRKEDITSEDFDIFIALLNIHYKLQDM